MRALRQTESRIADSLLPQNRDTPVHQEVIHALQTYFPNEDATFLPLLLRRVQLIQRVIPDVRLRTFDRAFFTTNNDPNIDLHLAALDIGMPARAFPQERYIALYSPSWDNHREFQPGILIHEAFHYYFNFMQQGHPRNNRRVNPFAYQGVISDLGNLNIGQRLRRNLQL